MELQNRNLTQPSVVAGNNDTEAGLIDKQFPAEAEIQAWLVLYLADLLDMDPDEVDVAISFDRYGVDSSAAVGLTGDLEDWLDRKLEPTSLYDYPTIEALARYLAESAETKA